MKKVYLLLVLMVSIFTFPLFSCAKTDPLISSVKELRQDIFEGSGDTLSLKANYGFVFKKDALGNNESKIFLLTVKILNGANENMTYTLNFNHNETDYSQEFRFNPLASNYVASMEVNDFTAKEFEVVITYSSTRERVILKSIVEENALSYQDALRFLRQHQSQLLDSYMDEDGNFLGHITARILVKDQKPYWYIGLFNNKDELKALLIDGTNGEVLAIREVL